MMNIYTRMAHSCCFSHARVLRTFKTMKNTRRKPILLTLAYLCTLFTFARTQSGGLSLNQECERTTANGSVEYLACLASTEALSQLNLTVSVDPVNSTCGFSPDESRLIYLTLRDGVPNKCDAYDSNFSHPPELIIDEHNPDAPTWWQSISWYDYPLPLGVNVTLSLDHSYSLAQSIVITFQSGRPKRMILEKSNDAGITWEILQYYSTDCLDDFSMQQTTESQIVEASEVICTQEYSGTVPYENGQVVYDVDRRLALIYSDMRSPELQVETYQNDTTLRNLLTLTDLRLRLLYPATDGLEIASNPIDFLKYYYAISNIESYLECNCNQHGRFCAPSPQSGNVVCECFHNTMGSNCELCLPLFNNRPWRAGSFVPYPSGTANECQKCTCNDHANSCTYNATLGYGVCQDCYDNTAGDFCNICVDGFFLNESRAMSDPNICIECNCERLGTVDNNTVCAQFADDATGAPIGQCECRDNVTGRACDQCVESYYGLLMEPEPGRCRECGCNELGTVNASVSCDQTSGQCYCKPYTDTRTCSECRDQYYGFPTTADSDCLSCGCDPGGSTSLTCNKVTGRCDCRGFVGGRTCMNVQSGYYYPYLDSNIYDAWEANTTCVSRSDFPSDGFSGLGYVECGVGDRTIFNGITAYSNVTETMSNFVGIRYTYNSQSPWLMASLIIATETENGSLSCPYPPGTVIASEAFSLEPGAGIAWSSTVSFGFHRGCSYSAVLDLESFGLGSERIVIDALVLLPDPSAFTVYSIAAPEQRGFQNECLHNVAAYSTRSGALNACQSFTFSIMLQMLGTALECACDPEGSLPQTVCLTYGGSCFCKPGVGGQNCDRCLPGYFNFTSNGCQACRCDEAGSITQACDFATGQCPCKPGVAFEGQTNHLGLVSDRQCSACQEDFFGFGSPDGCQACGCHPLGSVTLQCFEGGVCSCLETVGGEKCDTCLPGFFNLTSEGCSSCECDTAGSLSAECNTVSGTCTCKANVQGAKCDRCTPGFFNLDDANPSGCQPCFCYGHGSTCNAAPNYVQDFITSDFTQGGTSGWHLSDPTSLSINSANIRISHPPSLPSGESLYLVAPEEYLGFKLSSYGGSFSFSATLDNGEVDRSSNQYLLMSGGPQNMSVFYSAEEFVPTDEVMVFTASFYEGLWRTVETVSEVTVQEFLGILADITSIQIRASFGPNTVSSFLSASMETASLVSSSDDDSSVFVTTVEQCICNTLSNTVGLSCSSCSEGTKRQTPFGSPTDTCTPCFCNGRSQTCDPDSGDCIGCRPGTVGRLCESCAANVLEPSCDQCIPDYYGFGTDIFGGACSACNCNTTGTGGATQCNNLDGQCPCVGNFGEQQCDGCAYNYYNYELGCLKCDICYDGIENTHLRLVELQRNISQFVSDLESRDNSSIPTPFYQRLEDTNDLLVELIDTTSSTVQEGANLESTISALNGVIETLMSTLEGAIQNDIIFSKANASIAEENARLALEAIDLVNANITQAYDTLTSGDFQTAQSILESLRDDLLRQVTRLEEIRTQTANQVAALEEDVEGIRNLTQETLQAADEVLQTAQQAQVVHDNTTTRTATEVTHANNVALLAEQTIGEVQNVLERAQEIDYSARQKVADVEAARMSVDESRIDGVIAQAEVRTRQAMDIQNQANTALANAQGTINSVENTYITTQETQREVDATVAEVTQRRERAGVANQESAASVMLSRDTFNAAQDMLRITSDFDAQVADAQAEAFTSIEELPAINQQANQNLAQSEQLRAQLTGVVSTANEGTRVAVEALNNANSDGESVQPISQRAEQLYTEAANQLTDTDQITTSVDQLDRNQVQPALAACDGYQADIDALEALYIQAEDTAQQSTSLVTESQNKLTAPIQAITNIQHVDTSQLPDLQSRLGTSRALLSRQDYTTLVAALQQGLSEQEIWLEDTRATITELQAQIDGLQSFNVNP